MRRFFLLVMAGTVVAACSGAGQEDPCSGVDCSGHGICQVDSGQASCQCDTGYQPSADGRECLPGYTGPCQGQDCSGHGRCRVDDHDQPYCECDPGYWPASEGLACLEASCSGDCGVLGCCGDHCCRLQPANFAVVGALPEGGADITFSGGFDTVADCRQGAALGDCRLVEQAQGPQLCVCTCGSLRLTATTTISGAAALVVLAAQDIVLEAGASLDLSGRGEQAGPGAELPADEAGTIYGGRGGSFGSAGGNGGAVRGSVYLEPLLGGESGQAACGGTAGGGGGGAVQLSAGRSLTLAGTILALGGGGRGGGPSDAEPCCGGGGGGSGGGLLAEAPQVEFSGSFWATGGGGGGGGNNRGAAGGNGSDASAGGASAPGGAGRDGASCALYGAIEGGDGGAGSDGSGPGGDGQAGDQNMCDPDQPYVGGGGGGGGAGRIRINTASGSPCNCTGTMVPAASLGAIKLR